MLIILSAANDMIQLLVKYPLAELSDMLLKPSKWLEGCPASLTSIKMHFAIV